MDWEERYMVSSDNLVVGLFVDRSIPQHWIVLDRDGDFWLIPPAENPWENRERFYPTDETNLEPVPGHYMYVLGLPC
jgi:hypothetical protein